MATYEERQGNQSEQPGEKNAHDRVKRGHPNGGKDGTGEVDRLVAQAAVSRRFLTLQLRHITLPAQPLHAAPQSSHIPRQKGHSSERLAE